MFKLTDSTEVPGPKPLIQAGYPDKMTPDICIVDSTNIYSFFLRFPTSSVDDS